MSMIDLSTNDTPFAAYVGLYHSIQPWRVTTDFDGKATFHFKVSAEETFKQWRTEFDADAAVTGFVAAVRRLQDAAERADRSGGILTF